MASLALGASPGCSRGCYQDGGIAQATEVSAAMVVAPQAPFHAGGQVGGPFSPAQKSYLVSHSGGGPLRWSASSTAPWLVLDPGGGTLSEGESTWLTASIDPDVANGMTRSLHTAEIWIANETTGLGSALIATSLSISSRYDTRAPVLVAGPGFDGPTPQPPAVGNGRGSDAMAIARWDVVPNQLISADFNVGVVAFHMNRIDRVEFSLEGGPWAPVSSASLDPQTGVHEYWAVIRPQELHAAGPVELRAIAHPETGIPRILPSIWLQADPAPAPPLVRHASPDGSDETGDGSEVAPFRTMWKAARSIQDASPLGRADGGIVYLQAGDHVHGPPHGGADLVTVDTWVTFLPAPGVARSAVRIVDNLHPGMRTKFARYRNLTIRTHLSTASTPEAHVWLDGCALIGPGKEVDWHPAGWLVSFEGTYATDCTVSDDIWGVLGADLQRNVHCRRIGSDAFGATKLLVNCSVDGIDRGSQTSWHPDVYAINTVADIENYIVYGLRATNVKAQGLFLKRMTSLENFAAVNVLIDACGGLTSQFHEIGALEHILLQNVTIYGQSFLLRTSGSWKYLTIQGCAFDKIDGSDLPLKDDSGLRDNHYVGGNWTPGSAFTSGDPLYSDPAADDFHLQPASPLRGRLPRLVEADLEGAPRDPLASSVGAYE